MKQIDINKRVKCLVAETLEIDISEIEDDADFVKKYGADSITGIEILASIEAELGIHLPETYAARMINMNSIYQILREITQAKTVISGVST